MHKLPIFLAIVPLLFRRKWHLSVLSLLWLFENHFMRVLSISLGGFMSFSIFFDFLPIKNIANLKLKKKKKKKLSNKNNQSSCNWRASFNIIFSN